VLDLKTPLGLENVLKQKGYSEKAIAEVWKWYDFSERKGINF